ncbi:MAG: glucose-1-phosphate cytidylyltransferase [Granulosicoccus sp.]
MKVVILAGGLGTRISEETSVRPKPMVEIGSMPILWHIMKIYSAHGYNDFVVCLGYKGHMVKEFFANYLIRRSNVRIDLRSNKIEVLNDEAEPWTISLIDTGESAMTGGRIRQVRDHIDDSPFCLTYGDGVSDVNVTELVKFHQQEKSLVTLTAVQPPGRFGAIALAADDNRIDSFHEKPAGDGAWVNGGFFVCEPEVIDFIEAEDTVWEAEPLERVAELGRLNAFRHNGFWQPMDTLRDKSYLEELWAKPNPPWKVW